VGNNAKPFPENAPQFANNATRLAGLTAALLGWKPDEFWAATPAELATVLAAFSPSIDAAPDAKTLEQLKEQFPDG
jgi:hypothetical protein